MPKNILFIFTEWSISEYRRENNKYGGIGYYRIVKPAEYINKLYGDKYKVDVVGKELTTWGTNVEAFGRAARDYDLVFTKQADSPQACSSLLSACDYYGTPLIVDIDDDYLNVRKDNPAYEVYALGKQNRYILQAFLSLSQGMTVSTLPLQSVYHKLNNDRIILPNCNDRNDWDNIQTYKHNTDKIKIGYAGSITHNTDLLSILPALVKVMRKYRQVEFHLLGVMDKKTFKEQFAKMFGDTIDQVKMFFGTPSWEGYPELLKSTGWDIGIAPLIDDQFNRGKSHIKWLEYSMLKIPTVASRVYPYYQDIQGTKTIEHDKTGLLCNSINDWEINLSKLVENKQLRDELGQNSYDHVVNNWQYKDHIHKWIEVLDKYTNAI